MALSHTYTIRVQTPSATFSASDVIEADGENEVNATVEASSTLEEDVAVDVSAVKAFYIISDKDVTVKTNSSGSPAQTFVLTANEPLWWHNALAGATNPLTTDITKLFFVNAGLDAANVKASFLIDESP